MRHPAPASRLLLVVAACLPFGGCLTKQLWTGSGESVETVEAIAEYSVGSIGRDRAHPDHLVLHAVQTSGTVARALAERCGGDVFVHLQPDTDADAALAVLADERAFSVTGAVLAVDQRRVRSLLGERGAARLVLTIEVDPAALGAVHAAAFAESSNEAPVESAEPAVAADPLLQRVQQQCANDVLRTDWSAIDPRLGVDPAAAVVAWVGRDGVRRAPVERPAAAPEAVALDAGYFAWPLQRQLQALEGCYLDVRTRTATGENVLLRLDASRAWAYARAVGDGGRGRSIQQVSHWVPEMSRDLPTPDAPRTVTGWRVTLQTLDDRQREGPSFGGTMLRILATPFAIAADVVSTVAVVLISAALDGDDGPASASNG